jgi:UPF0755 protein
MRRVLYILSAFGLIAGLAAVGAGFWVYGGYTRPGPLERDTTLIIERGSGTSAIAQELNRAAVIENPFIFRLGARFFSDPVAMKAGEFLFPTGVSAMAAVKILQGGKTVMRRLTVAEGLTTSDVVALLRRTEGLTGGVVPEPEEGTLLPETYHFSFGDSRGDIINRMKTAQSRLLAELWVERSEGLPIDTPREALILASVVEKETGKRGERARVAAVFLNRIRKKMRLQSDPTVVYGITEGREPLGRKLSRKDLKTKTSYNTYVIKGLPPTPIANPGRDAIRAVLHPTASEDIYFVADGTGGHVFARTLAQHNRNVARWRKLQKRQKSAN